MPRDCTRELWALLGAGALHALVAWSAPGDDAAAPTQNSSLVVITWEPEAASRGTPENETPESGIVEDPAASRTTPPLLPQPRGASPLAGRSFETPSPAAQASDVSGAPDRAGPLDTASDAATEGGTHHAEAEEAWEVLPGTELGGVLGPPRAGSSGSGRGAGSVGRASRASFLAPRDFSRSPIPPNLSALVRRNYPVAARMHGHEGTVELRLLILPDGTPSALRVESVDPNGRGFGEACIRTVQHGPPWQPALGRNGYPVAAEVHFTCPFRLEQARATAHESKN